MSKKRRALWAWLTAFAMVLSVLSGHAGPYRAQAAEQAIPDTLELGKSYSGTLTSGKEYTVDTAYSEGDKFMVEMTVVSGAAIYKQIGYQSNARIDESSGYWAWQSHWAGDDGVKDGTLFAKTIEANASGAESRMQIKFVLDTLIDGATAGDGTFTASGLRITKASGPQYVSQAVNKPVSEVLDDKGWGFQKQFSIPADSNSGHVSIKQNAAPPSRR